jgi:hypothetical protein
MSLKTFIEVEDRYFNQKIALDFEDVSTYYESGQGPKEFRFMVIELKNGTLFEVKETYEEIKKIHEDFLKEND